MKNTRGGAQRSIAAEDWTTERAAEWEAETTRVLESVPLYHPWENRQVLVFPDASGGFWGCCMTQVPPEDAMGGPVEDMRHEPLAFLSGDLKRAQRRWSGVDEEAFAIMVTFLRLPYLFWGGVHVDCHHRNLACVFHPEACAVSTASKATAQRLQRLIAFLGQFRYTFVLIGSERHCWGDLLSRWI